LSIIDDAGFAINSYFVIPWFSFGSSALGMWNYYGVFAFFCGISIVLLIAGITDEMTLAQGYYGDRPSSCRQTQ